MQLSTRGRYAVMAMLDLAVMLEENEGKTPVTLAQIAERQEISLSYLEQLFAKLRKAGIVKSLRGPGGGYVLAQQPAQTLISDIIDAVDEPMQMTRCGKDCKKGEKVKKGCVAGRQCNAHNLWMALSAHIHMFMENVNLQMVLDDKVQYGPVLANLCAANVSAQNTV